jgi:PAS domain S-box-containing protein
LLELSRAAFQNTDADQLILLFCQQTRQFFHARGAYFWRSTPAGDLVGDQADGFNMERFRGLRLRARDQAVALEAIQRRRTTFLNDVDMTRYPKLARYPATSVMSAPLMVSNEIVGAITFVHDTPDSRFDEDSAAQATILATQLGTALEALRLNQLAREERRRTMILAEAATAFHSLSDANAVMEGMADRLRALLHSPIVLILVQEAGSFHLLAVSAETPVLARVIRSRFEASRLRPALEIAMRAAAASEPITVSIDGQAHFGEDSPPGVLIATAFRTSRSHGAILVYPRSTGPYTQEEKTLVSALAGFGAVAIENAELYDMARAGVLYRADRGTAPTAEDDQLLRAVPGHASVALQNESLFTRMEQANRHWMEVFDAISDFIVVHDEQHRILRANRSLADFVGLAPEQLIGINLRALEPLSVGTSPHSCPFCRNGDAFDEYLHSVLERTYLISTSRIHSASSAQLQTVHVLKDITDRREAERRYRELFDNIQEGIFFSTPQGRFIEVNDALVRILGYDSREELLQLDIPSQVYFSAQRREELTALLNQQGGLRNQEEVLRRKDGSPVRVYINCFALRDSRGQVVQYRGLMLDITGLRNSQSELQHERDFSGKVLNHTQSLILVTGTEGVISYANRRWGGLGFQPDQLLGRPFPELAATARREALRAALAAVAQGQQVDNFDLQLVRGDGVTGQFSVNLSPISAEDGSVSSIVVVMTDVTDSTLMQAKLVHTEKMAAVGQLVSGVAHEVNNPLTAILGFTDLLMENPDLPESARRDLRVILQEAQRTKQIVQNLLSFARQMPPQRHSVQLNSILRRTLQLRAYDFHSHGVEIVERLDESLPEVIGDSHQLQQVFLNIVNNAYDAVRETGRPARIEIMSARNGSWMEASFRDNGTGIGEADRIFDPFYTTKEVGKGTGLGLSICYGIVREHGGEIICHNNLDSEGATFIVRLPVASEAASLGAVAGAYPK